MQGSTRLDLTIWPGSRWAKLRNSVQDWHA
jgi:hypothetical protein